MDIIYNMIRRLLVRARCDRAQLRHWSEDWGWQQQAAGDPGPGPGPGLSGLRGHSTPAATAPVEEGTTARKGGKRKKAKNEMTIIIYNPLFHGFAPSLKCLFCFKHDIDI